MIDELTFNQLKVNKALERDWKLILEILKETELIIGFTGKENYKDFYIVIDINQKIIACFAIYIENNIGILKYFAVNPKIQSKGVGKYLANEILPVLMKGLGLTKLYLAAGNKDPFTSFYFWQKTAFKQISKNDIKDKYFLNYFSDVINKFSNYFGDSSAFYIEI